MEFLDTTGEKDCVCESKRSCVVPNNHHVRTMHIKLFILFAIIMRLWQPMTLRKQANKRFVIAQAHRSQ